MGAFTASKSEQKEIRVAILISDKGQFSTQNINLDKKHTL